MRVLNTDLMGNPLNWVVITLMVVLGSLMVRFITNAAQMGDA